MKYRQIFVSLYNILFLSLLGCLLIGGILLILNWWHWRASISFYLDECSVFLNSKLPIYKFFVKLPYAQVTPPFFSILTKLFTFNEELKESFLRLLPLSVTVISILLFPILEFKILKNKFAILVALTLLMFNPHIYEYSLFFKHYAFDVLIVIVILFIAIYIKDKRFKDKEKNDINSYKTPVILGILSCFCIWCSYTAAIIISGVFFAMLLYEKYKFQKINFKPYIIYLIPIIIFALYLLIFIFIPIKAEGCMEDFWFLNKEFQPLERTLSVNIYDNKIWYALSLFYIGGEVCYKLYNQLILLSLLIMSMSLFYKQDRFIFYFFITVIPVIFLLSILHIYPYGAHRVAVYSIPLFCILLSKAFDITFFKNKILSVIVFILLCFVIYNQNVYNNFIHFYKNLCIESLSNSAYFYKFLRYSDIKSDDYIYYTFPPELEAYIVGDEHNMNVSVKNIVPVSDDFNLIKPDKNIFFYLSKDYIPNNFDEIQDLIKNNCKIIYSVDDNTTLYPGTFIKCKKNTPVK